jgi:hypothetical protein
MSTAPASGTTRAARTEGGPEGARHRRAAGHRTAAILAALLMSAAAASAARAEGAPGDELASGDRPWQRGVDAGQRAAAEREFLDGNALFERSEYAAAAEKYRAALRSWEHPAIQFNLAVCLIHLERPVEAYDTVQAALRYGREALPEHFDEANNYERLLRDRIATLEVTLPVERRGTTVTLDGEPLLASAEEHKVSRRLAPGRHALVARRAHFETWSKDLVLPPGEVTREVIVLRAPRTRTVRRWSAAMPWWVAGTGGAAVAIGTASLLLGNANVRAVTAEVTRQCPPPSGCMDGLPSGLAGDRDRARLEQRVGVSLLVAGAATVATGVVLLVLNQPRQVLDTTGVALRVTPEEIGIGWSHAF